jgi:hypothetical protein
MSVGPIEGTVSVGTVGLISAAGVSPISLVHLTTNRQEYWWSEANISIASEGDSAGAAGNYMGWLVGQPKFQIFGSTQTDTGSISIQNISGNTVQRDASLQVSEYEFVGAFVSYLLYDAASQTALFSFTGNIADVTYIDEQQIDFSLEGFCNWSAVQAVPYNIGPTCGLYFGSMECGSTAATPCQQTYGNCSSIERFKGFVAQWNVSNLSSPLVQIAQPAPLVSFNPARTF